MRKDARSRTTEPVVVTGARASRQEDIRVRQRKYLLAMGFRTIAFIAAVILFSVGFRWAAIVLLGLSLLAPMIGVVIANNHARSPGGQPEVYRPDGGEEQKSITRGPTIDG